MTIELRDGKITANRSVLNYLCILCGEAEMRYNDLGCDALAKLARENQDRIFNALDKSGYYDDIN